MNFSIGPVDGTIAPDISLFPLKVSSEWCEFFDEVGRHRAATHRDGDECGQL